MDFVDISINLAGMLLYPRFNSCCSPHSGSICHCSFRLLVSVSEKTAKEDVDVRNESEIDVEIPVVLPSAGELASVSEEPSTDANVCEKQEIDLAGVANCDSLQIALGKNGVLGN